MSKKSRFTRKVFLGYDKEGNEVEMVVEVEMDLDRKEETMYYCKEIHRGSNSLPALIIHYFATKNLGNNEGSLVNGIVRALKLDEPHLNPERT